MKMIQNRRQLSPEIAGGILRRGEQVLGSMVVVAIVLFLAAGTFAWAAAWILLGLYLFGVSVNSVMMLSRHPETIAERASAARARTWDILIGGAWGILYYLVLMGIAGLDLRFAWTGQLALSIQVLGGMVFVLGFALFSWAMIANAWFTTLNRIEPDPRQTLCTDGPYRYVRHPGYAGALLQTLGMPLLLGSLWALVPGILAALLMVARTILEDRTLKRELSGYQDYARKVRYRLMPYVW